MVALHQVMTYSWLLVCEILEDVPEAIARQLGGRSVDGLYSVLGTNSAIG